LDSESSYWSNWKPSARQQNSRTHRATKQIICACMKLDSVSTFCSTKIIGYPCPGDHTTHGMISIGNVVCADATTVFS
jgi:hypothetical protein